MLKYVLILCVLIMATMLTIGGQKDGPVRDGLAGKYPPLVAGRAEPAAPVPEPPEPVAQAPEPLAPAAEAAQAAPTPPPAAEPAPAPSLTALVPEVVEGSPDDPLTLTLPEPPEPAAEAAPALRYVSANSVNLREGPSAETDSLGRLNRGAAVRVQPSDSPGWSLVTVEGTILQGYIATRFLGDTP
jgi:hypothetical protein